MMQAQCCHVQERGWEKCSRLKQSETCCFVYLFDAFLFKLHLPALWPAMHLCVLSEHRDGNQMQWLKRGMLEWLCHCVIDGTSDSGRMQGEAVWPS